MLHLEPESDIAVRDAVDAHLSGDALVQLEGDAVFETRNNRYRLLDGVVFEANDPSMRGSELVGWLIESPGDATLEATWHPGSRAVFVDPRLGKHIIVTSGTKRFAHGKALPSGGSMDHQPGSVVSQVGAPATGAPPPQPWAQPARAPLPARMPGMPVVPTAPFPKAPPQRVPAPAAYATPRTPPPPVPPSSRPPVTRAAPPIHAPPRPVARASAAPPSSRPLPAPIPPPAQSSTRYDIPMPVAPPSRMAIPRPPVPMAPPPPRSQMAPSSEPFPLTRNAPPRPFPRANV